MIFFHVTANSDWSNLPLSGLFVEMLRRIASLGGSGGAGEALVGDGNGDAADAPAAAEVLAPLQVLDGFGLLKTPPPTTQAIAAAKIADAKPSAEQSAGLLRPGRRAARAQPDDRPRACSSRCRRCRSASSGASTRATPPSRSSRSC